jgi:hypothetical protein
MGFLPPSPSPPAPPKRRSTKTSSTEFSAGSYHRYPTFHRKSRTDGDETDRVWVAGVLSSGEGWADFRCRGIPIPALALAWSSWMSLSSLGSRRRCARRVHMQADVLALANILEKRIDFVISDERLLTSIHCRGHKVSSSQKLSSGCRRLSSMLLGFG